MPLYAIVESLNAAGLTRSSRRAHSLTELLALVARADGPLRVRVPRLVRPTAR